MSMLLCVDGGTILQSQRNRHGAVCRFWYHKVSEMSLIWFCVDCSITKSEKISMAVCVCVCVCVCVDCGTTKPEKWTWWCVLIVVPQSQNNEHSVCVDGGITKLEKWTQWFVLIVASQSQRNEHGVCVDCGFTKPEKWTWCVCWLWNHKAREMNMVCVLIVAPQNQGSEHGVCVDCGTTKSEKLA